MHMGIRHSRERVEAAFATPGLGTLHCELIIAIRCSKVDTPTVFIAPILCATTVAAQVGTDVLNAIYCGSVGGQLIDDSMLGSIYS